MKSQFGVGGLGLWLAVGCSHGLAVSHFPQEQIPIPDGAGVYESAPRSEGAVGGPGTADLARKVMEALTSRGQRPQADGALASTACWGLARTHRGHQPTPVTLDAAARHYGFGGVVTAFVTFDTQTEFWRDQLDLVPANLPLNRFGICSSPSGRSAQLVVGAQEMDYEALPRTFEPGQQVTMRGRMGGRHKSAHVFLTKPDGTVDDRNLTGTNVDVQFTLSTVGPYRLEVIGDGPTGPAIVLNMPLYVGMQEPPIPESTGVAVDPEVAEARMLELLNQARKAAGVPPVVPDAELRKIAAGHTEDMADHHFVSHVSPSTGTPEDRVRRAGLVVAQFGENLAAAPTPEDAHSGLMESPGHRANMINPAFTHVGIAAASTDSGMVVTLNFGRRPRPEDLPNAAQVEAALRELRSKAGLSTPTLDPVYLVAAQAGADAMASGAAPDDIAKAEAEAMQREVDRLRTSRAGSCVLRVDLLEAAQLKQSALVTSPQLRRIGIGAKLRRDEHGARLSTVIMLEGVPCQ